MMDEEARDRLKGRPSAALALLLHAKDHPKCCAQRNAHSDPDCDIAESSAYACAQGNANTHSQGHARRT